MKPKQRILLSGMFVAALPAVGSSVQAPALARQFFGAAKTAGLGEPTGQTKTSMALDFFKPGR